MTEHKPVAWTSTSQLKRLQEQSTDHLLMWAENLRCGGDVPLYDASLLSEYESVKRENEHLGRACEEWAEVSQRSYQHAEAAEAEAKRLREALEDEASRVGPLTIEEIRAVFNRACNVLAKSEPPVGDWYASRSAEERAAGREQNAIAYERFEKASSDYWQRQCQYLLDVLDGQGFAERDMAEEDEAAIAGVRARLASSAALEAAR